MKFDKRSLLLYAVTDRSWIGEKSLYQQVEAALQGGTTFVQLREKELDFDSFLDEALEIKELCKEYRVPFVINDNVEIAIKSGAAGVHVGQSDMELTEARKKLGDDRIIGVSVQNVEQAVLAEKNGADYLGVGAVFTTDTKTDADYVSYDMLKSICSAVKIPVVAIGGIDEENIEKLSGSGICGVSVISAIFAQKDILGAAVRLKRRAEALFGGSDTE